MKISRKFGLCLIMVGVGLSAGWVMAVSASPYAYPQYPSYSYGPAPRPVPPIYGMPYRPGPMQQAEAYSSSASGSERSEPTATDAATVSIDQMRFEPSIITVKAGENVTWKHNGRMPHTVTANDRSFASQRLQFNGEFTQTFDNPGIHTYYCSLHPSMQGVVKVVE